MSVLTENSDPTLMLVGRYRESEQEVTENSPLLLNSYRKKALQDFLRRGIPGPKSEDYKYTNLRPAFSRDYEWLHHPGPDDFELKDIFKCDVPQLDTFLILLRNGWFRSFGTNGKVLPDGVVAGSLDKLARENPELLDGHYNRLTGSSGDPLAALNTAFAQDGYYLRFPKNVKVEQPIQVINLLQAASDSYVTQRNLIVVEPGAEVRLIICDHTLNMSSYLKNELTEIFIGENASVDFYTIQNQHNKAVSVNSTLCRLESNSRLTTQTITLHGGLVRNNLHVLLDGENSEANLYGLSFLDRRQHADNAVRVIHAKPNCLSNQHYKNVLDDESTGAFSGRIHVMRDAQKTNAYQRNNNLLLTDKARMQTKPQLVIEADDVKCSHGATVGQMNENALFYLRSRGIEESKARLMLMNAFSYEVVRQISVEPLRDRISELVDKRLRGEVGRCHECAYHCDC